MEISFKPIKMTFSSSELVQLCRAYGVDLHGEALDYFLALLAHRSEDGERLAPKDVEEVLAIGRFVNEFCEKRQRTAKAKEAIKVFLDEHGRGALEAMKEALAEPK